MINLQKKLAKAKYVCYNLLRCAFKAQQKISKEGYRMKQGIHPEYKQTTIRCACGEVIEIGSTREDIQVEINVSSLDLEESGEQIVEVSNISIVSEDFEDCWVFGKYKAYIAVGVKE